MTLAWRGYGGNGALAWLGYGDDLEALFGVTREIINLFTTLTREKTFISAISKRLDIHANFRKDIYLVTRINRLQAITSALELTVTSTTKLTLGIFLHSELRVLADELEKVEEMVTIFSSFADVVNLKSSLQRAKDLLTSITLNIDMYEEVE